MRIPPILAAFLLLWGIVSSNTPEQRAIIGNQKDSNHGDIAVNIDGTSGYDNKGENRAEAIATASALSTASSSATASASATTHFDSNDESEEEEEDTLYDDILNSIGHDNKGETESVAHAKSKGRAKSNAYAESKSYASAREEVIKSKEKSIKSTTSKIKDHEEDYIHKSRGGIKTSTHDKLVFKALIERMLLIIQAIIDKKEEYVTTAAIHIKEAIANLEIIKKDMVKKKIEGIGSLIQEAIEYKRKMMNDVILRNQHAVWKLEKIKKRLVKSKAHQVTWIIQSIIDHKKEAINEAMMYKKKILGKLEEIKAKLIRNKMDEYTSVVQDIIDRKKEVGEKFIKNKVRVIEQLRQIKKKLLVHKLEAQKTSVYEEVRQTSKHVNHVKDDNNGKDDNSKARSLKAKTEAHCLYIQKIIDWKRQSLYDMVHSKKETIEKLHKMKEELLKKKADEIALLIAKLIKYKKKSLHDAVLHKMQIINALKNTKEYLLHEKVKLVLSLIAEIIAKEEEYVNKVVLHKKETIIKLQEIKTKLGEHKFEKFGIFIQGMIKHKEKSFKKVITNKEKIIKQLGYIKKELFVQKAAEIHKAAGGIMSKKKEYLEGTLQKHEELGNVKKELIKKKLKAAAMLVDHIIEKKKNAIHDIVLRKKAAIDKLGRIKKILLEKKLEVLASHVANIIEYKKKSLHDVVRHKLEMIAICKHIKEGLLQHNIEKVELLIKEYIDQKEEVVKEVLRQKKEALEKLSKIKKQLMKEKLEEHGSAVQEIIDHKKKAIDTLLENKKEIIEQFIKMKSNLVHEKLAELDGVVHDVINEKHEEIAELGEAKHALYNEAKEKIAEMGEAIHTLHNKKYEKIEELGKTKHALYNEAKEKIAEMGEAKHALYNEAKEKIAEMGEAKHAVYAKKKEKMADVGDAIHALHNGMKEKLWEMGEAKHGMFNEKKMLIEDALSMKHEVLDKMGDAKKELLKTKMYEMSVLVQGIIDKKEKTLNEIVLRKEAAIHRLKNIKHELLENKLEVAAKVFEHIIENKKKSLHDAITHKLEMIEKCKIIKEQLTHHKIEEVSLMIHEIIKHKEKFVTRIVYNKQKAIEKLVQIKEELMKKKMMKIASSIQEVIDHKKESIKNILKNKNEIIEQFIEMKKALLYQKGEIIGKVIHKKIEHKNEFLEHYIDSKKNLLKAKLEEIAYFVEGIIAHKEKAFNEILVHKKKTIEKLHKIKLELLHEKRESLAMLVHDVIEKKKKSMHEVLLHKTEMLERCKKMKEELLHNKVQAVDSLIKEIISYKEEFIKELIHTKEQTIAKLVKMKAELVEYKQEKIGYLLQDIIDHKRESIYKVGKTKEEIINELLKVKKYLLLIKMEGAGENLHGMMDAKGKFLQDMLNQDDKLDEFKKLWMKQEGGIIPSFHDIIKHKKKYLNYMIHRKEETIRKLRDIKMELLKKKMDTLASYVHDIIEEKKNNLDDFVFHTMQTISHLDSIREQLLKHKIKAACSLIETVIQRKKDFVEKAVHIKQLTIKNLEKIKRRAIAAKLERIGKLIEEVIVHKKQSINEAIESKKEIIRKLQKIKAQLMKKDTDSLEWNFKNHMKNKKDWMNDALSGLKENKMLKDNGLEDFQKHVLRKKIDLTGILAEKIHFNKEHAKSDEDGKHYTELKEHELSYKEIHYISAFLTRIFDWKREFVNRLALHRKDTIEKLESVKKEVLKKNVGDASNVDIIINHVEEFLNKIIHREKQMISHFNDIKGSSFKNRIKVELFIQKIIDDETTATDKLIFHTKNMIYQLMKMKDRLLRHNTKNAIFLVKEIMNSAKLYLNKVIRDKEKMIHSLSEFKKDLGKKKSHDIQRTYEQANQKTRSMKNLGKDKKKEPVDDETVTKEIISKTLHGKEWLMNKAIDHKTNFVKDTLMGKDKKDGILEVMMKAVMKNQVDNAGSAMKNVVKMQKEHVKNAFLNKNEDDKKGSRAKQENIQEKKHSENFMDMIMNGWTNGKNMITDMFSKVQGFITNFGKKDGKSTPATSGSTSETTQFSSESGSQNGMSVSFGSKRRKKRAIVQNKLPGFSASRPNTGARAVTSPMKPSKAKGAVERATSESKAWNDDWSMRRFPWRNQGKSWMGDNDDFDIFQDGINYEWGPWNPIDWSFTNPNDMSYFDDDFYNFDMYDPARAMKYRVPISQDIDQDDAYFRISSEPYGEYEYNKKLRTDTQGKNYKEKYIPWYQRYYRKRMDGEDGKDSISTNYGNYEKNLWYDEGMYNERQPIEDYGAYSKTPAYRRESGIDNSYGPFKGRRQQSPPGSRRRTSLESRNNPKGASNKNMGPTEWGQEQNRKTTGMVFDDSLQEIMKKYPLVLTALPNNMLGLRRGSKIGELGDGQVSIDDDDADASLEKANSDEENREKYNSDPGRVPQRRNEAKNRKRLEGSINTRESYKEPTLKSEDRDEKGHRKRNNRMSKPKDIRRYKSMPKFSNEREYSFGSYPLILTEFGNPGLHGIKRGHQKFGMTPTDIVPEEEDDDGLSWQKQYSNEMVHGEADDIEKKMPSHSAGRKDNKIDKSKSRKTHYRSSEDKLDEHRSTHSEWSGSAEMGRHRSIKNKKISWKKHAREDEDNSIEENEVRGHVAHSRSKTDGEDENKRLIESKISMQSGGSSSDSRNEISRKGVSKNKSEKNKSSAWTDSTSDSVESKRRHKNNMSWNERGGKSGGSVETSEHVRGSATNVHSNINTEYEARWISESESSMPKGGSTSNEGKNLYETSHGKASHLHKKSSTREQWDQLESKHKMRNNKHIISNEDASESKEDIYKKKMSWRRHEAEDREENNSGSKRTRKLNKKNDAEWITTSKSSAHSSNSESDLLNHLDKRAGHNAALKRGKWAKHDSQDDVYLSNKLADSRKEINRKSKNGIQTWEERESGNSNEYSKVQSVTESKAKASIKRPAKEKWSRTASHAKAHSASTMDSSSDSSDEILSVKGMKQNSKKSKLLESSGIDSSETRTKVNSKKFSRVSNKAKMVSLESIETADNGSLKEVSIEKSNGHATSKSYANAAAASKTNVHMRESSVRSKTAKLVSSSEAHAISNSDDTYENNKMQKKVLAHSSAEINDKSGSKHPPNLQKNRDEVMGNAGASSKAYVKLIDPKLSDIETSAESKSKSKVPSNVYGARSSSESGSSEIRMMSSQNKDVSIHNVDHANALRKKNVNAGVKVGHESNSEEIKTLQSHRVYEGSEKQKHQKQIMEKGMRSMYKMGAHSSENIAKMGTHETLQNLHDTVDKDAHWAQIYNKDVSQQLDTHSEMHSSYTTDSKSLSTSDSRKKIHTVEENSEEHAGKAYASNERAAESTSNNEWTKKQKKTLNEASTKMHAKKISYGELEDMEGSHTTSVSATAKGALLNKKKVSSLAGDDKQSSVHDLIHTTDTADESQDMLLRRKGAGSFSANAANDLEPNKGHKKSNKLSNKRKDASSVEVLDGNWNSASSSHSGVKLKKHGIMEEIETANEVSGKTSAIEVSNEEAGVKSVHSAPSSESIEMTRGNKNKITTSVGDLKLSSAHSKIHTGETASEAYDMLLGQQDTLSNANAYANAAADIKEGNASDGKGNTAKDTSDAEVLDVNLASASSLDLNGKPKNRKPIGTHSLSTAEASAMSSIKSGTASLPPGMYQSKNTLHGHLLTQKSTASAESISDIAMAGKNSHENMGIHNQLNAKSSNKELTVASNSSSSEASASIESHEAEQGIGDVHGKRNTISTNAHAMSGLSSASAKSSVDSVLNNENQRMKKISVAKAAAKSESSIAQPNMHGVEAAMGEAVARVDISQKHLLSTQDILEQNKNGYKESNRKMSIQSAAGEGSESVSYDTSKSKITAESTGTSAVSQNLALKYNQGIEDSVNGIGNYISGQIASDHNIDNGKSKEKHGSVATASASATATSNSEMTKAGKYGDTSEETSAEGKNLGLSRNEMLRTNKLENKQQGLQHSSEEALPKEEISRMNSGLVVSSHSESAASSSAHIDRESGLKSHGSLGWASGATATAHSDALATIRPNQSKNSRDGMAGLQHSQVSMASFAESDKNDQTLNLHGLPPKKSLTSSVSASADASAGVNDPDKMNVDVANRNYNLRAKQVHGQLESLTTSEAREKMIELLDRDNVSKRKTSASSGSYTSAKTEADNANVSGHLTLSSSATSAAHSNSKRTLHSTLISHDASQMSSKSSDHDSIIVHDNAKSHLLTQKQPPVEMANSLATAKAEAGVIEDTSGRNTKYLESKSVSNSAAAHAAVTDDSSATSSEHGIKNLKQLHMADGKSLATSQNNVQSAPSYMKSRNTIEGHHNVNEHKLKSDVAITASSLASADAVANVDNMSIGSETKDTYLASAEVSAEAESHEDIASKSSAIARGANIISDGLDSNTVSERLGANAYSDASVLAKAQSHTDVSSTGSLATKHSEIVNQELMASKKVRNYHGDVTKISSEANAHASNSMKKSYLELASSTEGSAENVGHAADKLDGLVVEKAMGLNSREMSSVYVGGRINPELEHGTSAEAAAEAHSKNAVEQPYSKLNSVAKSKSSAYVGVQSHRGPGKKSVSSAGASSIALVAANGESYNNNVNRSPSHFNSESSMVHIKNAIGHETKIRVPPSNANANAMANAHAWPKGNINDEENEIEAGYISASNAAAGGYLLRETAESELSDISEDVIDMRKRNKNYGKYNVHIAGGEASGHTESNSDENNAYKEVSSSSETDYLEENIRGSTTTSGETSSESSNEIQTGGGEGMSVKKSTSSSSKVKSEKTQRSKKKLPPPFDSSAESVNDIGGEYKKLSPYPRVNTGNENSVLHPVRLAAAAGSPSEFENNFLADLFGPASSNAFNPDLFGFSGEFTGGENMFIEQDAWLKPYLYPFGDAKGMPPNKNSNTMLHSNNIAYDKSAPNIDLSPTEWSGKRYPMKGSKINLHAGSPTGKILADRKPHSGTMTGLPLNLKPNDPLYYDGERDKLLHPAESEMEIDAIGKDTPKPRDITLKDGILTPNKEPLALRNVAPVNEAYEHSKPRKEEIDYLTGKYTPKKGVSHKVTPDEETDKSLSEHKGINPIKEKEDKCPDLREIALASRKMPSKTATDIIIIKRSSEGPVGITKIEGNIPPLVTFRLVPRHVYEQLRSMLRKKLIAHPQYPIK